MPSTSIPINKEALTSLAIHLKNGDRQAIDGLYEEMNPKVYGFFFMRTGYNREVAEDLSQDIFVRLMQRIKGFDETKGGFLIWFWQIARNMLIDHYRTKKSFPFSMYDDDYVEAMSVTLPMDVNSRLKYLKVEEVLQSMAPDERKLFQLRYIKEMSYKEISTVLGKSEGSLRVASLRVKEKIRRKGEEGQWNAV